jgi:hypothetical protein
MGAVAAIAFFWSSVPNPAMVLNAQYLVPRVARQHFTVEPNRAKPPDEGRFVPEGEPRRTGARGAHLLSFGQKQVF